MKRHKHWWEGIGLVLGILALLLVARTLLNAQPPAVSEPAGITVTATAIPPSATPEAEATATVAATQVPTATSASAEATAIPLCSFAVPTQTQPTSESLLDTYVFSEPRVVLTSETSIDIAQWLPDGHRLLITRLIPEQARHHIEILNTETGETENYGESVDFSSGFHGSNKPIWLTATQSVAYVDFAPNDPNKLYINQGESKSSEVAIDLASVYLDAGSDGKSVIYFLTENQGTPLKFEPDQAQFRLLTTNLNLPNQNTPIVDYFSHYQIAVRPNSEQVAFYNNNGLYLVDTSNGQVCEMDLREYNGHKQWTLLAQWSPDGRYLAAFVTIGKPVVPYIHLTLVDISTGEQHLIDLNNDSLYAMAWSPNSRDFLLLAQDPEIEHRHSLYLVDTGTKEIRSMLEEYPFMYSGFSGVAWSPNGQNIALTCPIVISPGAVVTQEQLCMIAVEVNR